MHGIHAARLFFCATEYFFLYSVFSKNPHEILEIFDIFTIFCRFFSKNTPINFEFLLAECFFLYSTSTYQIKEILYMKKFFNFVALLSSLAVLSNFMSCSSDSSDDSSSTVNGPGSSAGSAAPDISITYNRNISSSDTESFTKEVTVTDDKATYTVEECPWEPASDDYVFACWKSGGSDLYPGETIEFEGEDREITYKAFWISKSDTFTHTTTYYRNSDSSGDSETIVQYYDWTRQSEVALKACPWTVEGKKFVGWANFYSGTGTVYKEYERVPSFAGIKTEYYAIWK